MIATVAAVGCLIIAKHRVSPPPEIIVFAAQRFDQNLGKVFSTGPTHLYSIHKDGTNLKQITSGKSYDLLPSLSKDRQHILLWRSKVEAYLWDVAVPFELCSVSVDGSDLRRLNRRYFGNLTDGLAQAFERFPNLIRTTKVDSVLSFLDGRGRPFITATDPRFNSSRDRFITYQDLDLPPDQAKRLIVDMKSRKVTVVQNRYYAPLWIDDKSIVAVLGKNNTVVILDDRGHELTRKSLKSARKNQKIEDDWIESEHFYGRERSACALWDKKIFLMHVHHPDSGGGYDELGQIDMNKGTYRFVGGQRVEAVSSDGLSFVGAEYDWVGGWKGAGARKLCKLYLWDAKKLTSRPIGFRLMQCEGACFAPQMGEGETATCSSDCGR